MNRISTDRGTSYALASVLSYVFNPLVYPPILLALVLWHHEAPTYEMVETVGVAVAAFILVPVGYVGYLVRRGEAASFELPRREKRIRPLLVSIASCLAALLIIYARSGTAATLLVALMGCYLINLLLVLVVTAYWKVSIHTSACAGFASMLLFVATTPFPTPGSPVAFALTGAAIGLLALPALAWARVRTGAHTLAQAVAGSFFGALLPWIELSILVAEGA